MIFKRTKISDDSVDIAKKILNQEWLIYRAWPTIKFDKEITWKEDPFNNGTWCFYLHSLDVISYLMNAYEIDANNDYLNKAKEIIESWIDKNNPKDIEHLSRFAWKDHSVANRVVNYIYFWVYYKKNRTMDEQFVSKLMKSLVQHGDYLADDNNHTYKNNHGIFQLRSLLQLALLFPDFKESTFWYEQAIKQLNRHIDKDISPNGVHLEHSAEYHVLVMKLFNEINDFLLAHGKSHPLLTQTVMKMENYLASIYKPNGTLPMTGDSGTTPVSALRDYNFLTPEMRYVFSNGRQGVLPKQDVVYKDEGVAVFRNSLLNGQQLYFMFTAAMHSHIHKHADDLSFVLTIDQTDVFIDSGKYNYQESDRIRHYFKSPLAHNCVTVDHQSYAINSRNIGKAKIIHSFINSDYKLVTGVHTLYPDVEIRRTMILVGVTNSILIHDELKSDSEHTYTQTFNLGKEMNVVQHSKHKIRFENTNGSVQVELIQLQPVSNYHVYYGSEEPLAGWISTKFNRKEPIYQIRFEKRGTVVEFLTIINTDKSAGIQSFSRNESGNYELIFKNNVRQYIHPCL